MRRIRDGRPFCPVEVTVDVIGKKWKPVILWYLKYECRRFSELEGRMPGVAHKVLTQQLRELERDGVIARRVIGGGGKHVEYSLTASGESLVPILDLMHEWGRSHDVRTGRETVTERAAAAATDARSRSVVR